MMSSPPPPPRTPLGNMAKLNVNNRGLIALLLLTLGVMALMTRPSGVRAAPSLASKSWPPMKNYDIWGPPPPSTQYTEAEESLRGASRDKPSSSSRTRIRRTEFDSNLRNGTVTTGGGGGSDTRFRRKSWAGGRSDGEAGFGRTVTGLDGESDGLGFGSESNDFGADGVGFNRSSRGRSAKVLNFFPVPVDDECLSDDGLRTGQCMNVYECRIQGGAARGQCALGFGVCCIFTATCDQEMANNITYFLSPSFPALLPKDMTACKLKIKLMNAEITQLKFDFIHFALGQPNRRTGICDGDVFKLAGGVFPFNLCGQNSGQHMYYDLSPQARADEEIELEMNFSPRSFVQRLWEIRVTQIPFSQRAPSGCMQYFTGTEGIIQTFNFAENGRHLANHNYRACIRQEKGMCSVAYEPCHDQSFRIGNPLENLGSGGTGAPGGGGPAGGVAGAPGASGGPAGTGTFTDPGIAADPLAPAADIPAADAGTPGAADAGETPGLLDSPADDAVAADEPAVDDPVADESSPDETLADDPDAEEGSGGGGGGFFSSFFPSFFSRRSIFDSYRSFEGSNRQGRYARQFGSTCTDRITLPCIIEDFIGAGMGDVPSCSPVHCGNSLCPIGVSPCRVETSVTPFGLGIHFGEGLDKGSPEDNIGACLRYNQLPCAE